MSNQPQFIWCHRERFNSESPTAKALARRGELRTPHGVIQTPVFMPVGTRGAVKAVTHRQLEELGAEIILGNTYHLFLRPGADLIARAGGLHRFIGWDRPILTDSGGYQVFSLATMRRIREEGAEFRSHLDGALHVLTPELATDVQAQLGSDIAMVLDECIATPATGEAARESMERSIRWARRARDRFLQLKADPSPVTVTNPGQAQFGIVQGATFPDLRAESAAGTMAIGFEAYAIGGLSVGEPPEVMYEVRGAHRAAAAGRSPPLPHGDGHAGRPLRVRGAGNRHVRLRPADPQRAQRPVPDEPGAAVDQERPFRRGPGAARSGLRVLHLPDLFEGVSPPPLYVRGDDRGHPQLTA